ncbi:MAG: response regulator [Prolixibacteraceae bacterium]|jgi:CheY-like chemotaxis protein|nr:response regulator [Prolixibacteraceae bacterium]
MDYKELKVLLIENQPLVAESIKKEFEALGGRVATALSTQNGLLRAKAFQFNLVVVNCGSDSKEGLNFISKLIKETGYDNIPVLFTVNPMLKVDIRLRKLDHMFDILRLPFDPTELRIRLNKIFAKGKESNIEKGKGLLDSKPKTNKKETEDADDEKGRVLLVEDNPLNQKVLGMFISKIGFDFDVASNGQIAIDLSRKQKYKFILMDIYMPEMDGTEATVKIREEEEEGSHRAKIIAITANESEESVKRCYDSGMDDYMVKPFTVDLLKEKLV